MSPLIIYEFTDYRLYLKEFMQSKKNENKSFSYRNFTLRAGLTTSNYVQKVISNERSLGPKTTEQFIKGLGLKKKEAEYFRKIVELDKSNTIERKASIISDLARLKKSGSPLKMTEENEFYNHWLNGAIYELAACIDFEPDSSFLYKKLKKRVGLSEIQTCLNFLLKNNYLKIENGKAIQVKDAITSTQFINNAHLRMNHLKMTEFAINAISMPIEERTFQGVLLSIDKKRMPEIKNKIKEFTEEILKEFSEDCNANTLYRFNLQAFPLTE